MYKREFGKLLEEFHQAVVASKHVDRRQRDQRPARRASEFMRVCLYRS